MASRGFLVSILEWPCFGEDFLFNSPGWIRFVLLVCSEIPFMILISFTWVFFVLILGVLVLFTVV